MHNQATYLLALPTPLKGFLDSPSLSSCSFYEIIFLHPIDPQIFSLHFPWQLFTPLKSHLYGVRHSSSHSTELFLQPAQIPLDFLLPTNCLVSSSAVFWHLLLYLAVSFLTILFAQTGSSCSAAVQS